MNIVTTSRLKRIVTCAMLLLALVAASIGGAVLPLVGANGGTPPVYAECDGPNLPPDPNGLCPTPTPTPTPRS